jgi:hypothetical protein
LKDRFETLCKDLGNHGPFVEAGVSAVIEKSVFIGGSTPMFELVQMLCNDDPDRFVAEKQPFLALAPSDFDALSHGFYYKTNAHYAQRL